MTTTLLSSLLLLLLLLLEPPLLQQKLPVVLDKDSVLASAVFLPDERVGDVVGRLIKKAPPAG